MFIKSLRLTGLFLITEEPIQDERGEFSRVFCRKTFAENGLVEDFFQINRSISLDQHTLRGLHFQTGEFAEAKYVRVLNGAIFDVAVDTRTESSTFLQWEAVKLVSGENKGFYLSPGFAHGIMTLEPNTQIEYLVSQPYNGESERGYLWNDPAIGIDWPSDPTVVSHKDSNWLPL